MGLGSGSPNNSGCGYWYSPSKIAFMPPRFIKIDLLFPAAAVNRPKTGSSGSSTL